LLGSVSLVALTGGLLLSSGIEAQQTPPAFSAQWFAARQSAGASRSSAGAKSPTSGVDAKQLASVNRAMANMSAAAITLRAQLTGQKAARDAARRAIEAAALPNIPDGLKPGGLEVSPDLGVDGIVWENAKLPVETDHPKFDDHRLVTVEQTGQRSILTWKTFNVGAKTELYFQQRENGAPRPDWIALNRVLAAPPDPVTGKRQVAAPSHILGKISADGEVWVVNQNGIVFGGTSQVNVRNLTATTLDTGLPHQVLRERNQYFRERTNNTSSFSFQYLYQKGPDGKPVLNAAGQPVIDTNDIRPAGSVAVVSPKADLVEGRVHVHAGAVLSVPGLSKDNQAVGRIVLAAPEVINEGTIDAPDGEAILLGSRNFSLVANTPGDLQRLRAEANLTTATSGAFNLVHDPERKGALVAMGAADFFTVAGPQARNALNARMPNVPGFSTVRPAPVRVGSEVPAISHPGRVINRGIVHAARGTTSLVAHQVIQAGAVAATSAVNANGSIFITGQDIENAEIVGAVLETETSAGSVTFEADSLTTILPDTDVPLFDSNELLAGDLPSLGFVPGQPRDLRLQADADRPVLASRGDQTLPSDEASENQFQRSKIDITAAASGYSFNLGAGQAISEGWIALKSGSLIVAPGAAVNLTASQPARPPFVSGSSDTPPLPSTVTPSIVVEGGAQIDVAGLMNVELPMAANALLISRVGQIALADSGEAQRDGPLFRKTVVIDRRLSGVRDDGIRWVGTPVIDATGNAQARGREIDELLIGGGSINFSGATVAKSGSALNVSGGYLRFLDGAVPTTNLVLEDGSGINIGAADRTLVFRGIATGRQTFTSARWGVERSFGGLGAVAAQRLQFERSYIQGADAGTLSFVGPAVVKSTLHGGSVAGVYQRTGSGPFSTPMPNAGTLDFSEQTFVSKLTFVDGEDDSAPADSAEVGVAVDTAVFAKQELSTNDMRESGFGHFLFTSLDRFDETTGQVDLPEGANLRLPPGGSLTVKANNVSIGGTITAPGGTVRIALDALQNINAGETKRTTLTVEETARIDLRGLWINDFRSTRDTLIGSDFIDGGTFEVVNGAFEGQEAFLPDVSTIDVRPGSLIDLSSGGYVRPDGFLATDGDGVPLGKGGSLSILLHPPATEPPDGPAAILDGETSGNSPNIPNAFGVTTMEPDSIDRRTTIDDKLLLGGEIRAFGFQGGGTFALRAPEIKVVEGDGPVGGDRGQFQVSTGFLESRGFGAYQLTGLLLASLDPGTTVRLTPRQLIPLSLAAPLAGSIEDAARVGIALGAQRRAVDFSLAGLGWTDFNNIASVPDGRSFYAENALTIGEGAAILGDPGASITLAARGQLTVLGTVEAPGGSINVVQRLGGAVRPQGDTTPFLAYSNQSLFLGDNAALNVDGVFLPDPTSTVFRAGEVLDGGTVAIDADILLGRAGAEIRASGAVATLDLPGFPGASRGNPAPAQTIGSDGGTINLTIREKGAFDGTLKAEPGRPGNRGGTLNVDALSITVVGSGPILPADTAPGRVPPPLSDPANPTDPSRKFLVLSADQLDGSGIDAIRLAASLGNSIFRSESRNEGIIAFSGPSTLSLGCSIQLFAGSFAWLPAGELRPFHAPPGNDADVRNSDDLIRIEAPYIRLAQSDLSFKTFPGVNPGDGPALEARATALDVEGTVVFENFGRTVLDAAGDVRLIPTRNESTGLPFFTAGIAAAGNLEIRAAQVYASTAIEGFIRSFAPGGTVRIIGNGNAAPVPLSAASRLVFGGANVIQSGVVRAPFGTVVLGTADINVNPTINGDGTRLPFVATTRVTVEDGSLTSVSGAGISVPFGETVNGVEWFYRARDAAPLSQPPAKEIRLVAREITVADGATLDLSGSGEVFATEFIPGLGGSRNVLRTSTTTDPSAPVYAILPGVQPAVAPVDPEGYSNLVPDLPGLTLTTLASVPGLPAGTYTLLPGSYAVLPGAFRVQALPSSTDTRPGIAVPSFDGTLTVAGRTGYLGTTIQSGRTLGYSIQSGPVWRQYSEIVSTSAGSFFSNLAAERGTAIPQRPADAGRLALIGTKLAFAATPLFGRGPGGRSGELDISSAQILVLGEGRDRARDEGNFLVLTPEQIDRFGAGSILLGAVRASESGGDRLTTGATDIRVRTSEDDPLTAPELMLAATKEILVDDGSVIWAEGEASGRAPGEIRFGRVPVTPTPPAPSDPGAPGDVAFLRVSNGEPVLRVSRINVPAAPQARITLGDDSRIDGGKALTLDAPGTIDNSLSARFGAEAVDLGTDRINILPGATSEAGTNLSADVLASLAGVQSLALRARTAITVFDAVAIQANSLVLDTPSLIGSGLGAGDEVSIEATSLLLINTQGTTSPSGSGGGTGTLKLSSEALEFGAGAKVYGGFGRYELRGTKRIAFGVGKSTGSLRLEGDAELVSPLIMAATGGTQALTASGTLTASGASVLTDTAKIDDIGGKLTLAGQAVTLGTTIAARAGVLDVVAETGDLVLGDGGRLVAEGYVQPFRDITHILSGGRIGLTARQGDLTIEDGAQVGVDGATGGHAGTVKIALGGAAAVLTVDGDLTGQQGGTAADERIGGTFLLDTGGAVSLDPLAAKLMAGGFTNRVAIRSGQGDLMLSTTDLQAHEFALVADGGRVVVERTVDASGRRIVTGQSTNAAGEIVDTIDGLAAAGGRIEFYGTGGVTLSGATLLAQELENAPTFSTEIGQRGGQVMIGTSGRGAVVLDGASTIDVSGGSDYGSGGGVVHVRTPYVDGAGNPLDRIAGQGQVATATALDADIVGATVVILEPYVTVSQEAAITSQATWDALINQRFNPDTTNLEDRFSGVFVQPGLEVVNPNGNLVINDPAADRNTNQAIVLDFRGRRFGADGVQPGWLTLRARDDIQIDASITDGFRPRDAGDNLARVDETTKIADDLVTGGWSWSYRFAAGARAASAAPLAVQDAVSGSFRFGDEGFDPVLGYKPATAGNVSPLGRNDLLRTGTGSIQIAAAGDVQIRNPSAAIYTAGTQAALPDTFVDKPAGLADLRPIYRGNTGNNVRPEFDRGAPGAGLYATPPAFLTGGGDIRIAAGGGVSGQQHVGDGRSTSAGTLTSNRLNYIGQVFTPWLFFQGIGSSTPDQSGTFGGTGRDATPTVPFPAQQSASWVMTGMFQQGIAALGGGDVVVRAGGNLSNTSLSVVSTYVVSGGKSAREEVTLHRFGGGNLLVETGGDIESSIVYVGHGQGKIASAGSFVSTKRHVFRAGTAFVPEGSVPIGTVIGLGDASMTATARGSIDLAQVFGGRATNSQGRQRGYGLDPEQFGLPGSRRFAVVSPYEPENAFRLASAGGDLVIGQSAPPPTTYGTFDQMGPELSFDYNSYMPPTVEIAAPRGGITLVNQVLLAPAPLGGLDVLAGDSILYHRINERRNTDTGPSRASRSIRMLDIAPALLSNPLNPNTFLTTLVTNLSDRVSANRAPGYNLDNDNTSDGLSRFTHHAGPDPLHGRDTRPSHLIALSGDIVSGRGLDSEPVPGVAVDSSMGVFLNEAVRIFAGGDIVNMSYNGENNTANDVTSIQAGGDITFAIEPVPISSSISVPVAAGGSFIIGGPGTFLIQAGGDLNLRQSEPDQIYGILAVGNRINPYRSEESADVLIQFGVRSGLNLNGFTVGDQAAGGVTAPGFIDLYIDPDGPSSAPYLETLLAFMQQRARVAGEEEPATAADAFAEFSALDDVEQIPFVEALYFAELVASRGEGATGLQLQNPKRLYAAVQALFPAELGYTDQQPGPGRSIFDEKTGDERRRTGNFNMINAVVSTNAQSDISLVGPGGDAQVGGLTIDDRLPSSFQGIFTQRGGAIRTYLDGNLNVNASRMFTLLGGGITIVSANGNIDAGRGRQTVSFRPPLRCAFNATASCSVDFGGLVTGSGIGTLSTLPGVEPSDVVLLAPRGEIDFGEAGVRVSGNLEIASQTVANVENVQVSGASFGLTQAPSGTSGAVGDAGGSEAAVSSAAVESVATAAGGNRAPRPPIASIITVEVIGFGERERSVE
jgi:filamentous hemagglutinin family protein